MTIFTVGLCWLARLFKRSDTLDRPRIHVPAVNLTPERRALLIEYERRDWQRVGDEVV